MKHGLIIAIVLLGLDASSRDAAPVVAQLPKKAPPLTREKLKKLAAAAVADGSAKPARTIIDAEDGSYYLGHFPMEDDDALEFAAALQIQVEVLRKRMTQKKAKNFWNSYLGKLEGIVVQSLQLAEKENNDEVRMKIAKLWFTAWELLAEGFDKWDKYKPISKLPKYELVYSIKPEQAAKADIYYVKWGRYQQLKEFGLLSQLEQYWRRPPTQVYEGEYFFAARWRGKTVLPKQSVSIDRKNQKVTLSFE